MTKAPPLGSLQAFCDALSASGLVDAAAIAALPAGGESDPKALARKLVVDGRLTKWQAGQLLHGFSALMIGKYKLLEQLGVGELGRVYLAEHAQMGNRVAVKILARKYTAKPELLNRILAEARRISALEHRNLSHMRDVNVDGDRYYFVIDYVEAQDLQRIVEKEGPRSPAAALGYLRQAADALAFCHRNQVVHGGLKPSNLLVDGGGAVTVLDVGLACLAHNLPPSSPEESTETAGIFAQAFHAPECSADTPPDVRSDVYSLGAVLFYLVSGKPPLAGGKSLEQLNGQGAKIPLLVQDLCRTLLAQDPKDRPATDRALLAAIDTTIAALGSPKAPAKALPKAAALPGAGGASPTAGGNAPAAAEAPKAKKPPVAKALPLPEAPAAAASATPPAADDPFGGFKLNTGGKSAAAPPAKSVQLSPAAANAPPALGGKPPVATGGKSAPPPVASKPDSGKPPAAGKPAPARAAGKPANSNLVLLLAAGVGGGLLVLAMAAGLIIYLASGGKGEPVVAKAEGEAQAAATDPANPAPAPEANPAPPGAETNPAPPVEANPTPPAPANPTPPVAAPGPATPATTTPGVNPAVPPATSNPGTGAPGDPANPPVTPPAEPKPPEPSPTPTPPTPKNPPPKNPSPKTPPPAKTPPPPAKTNPFEGFRTTVTLPKLPPPTATQVPTDVLAEVELGPMQVAPMAIVIMTLKGGEQAYKPGKNKFTIESADGGTALRDWEVRLEGGPQPIVIAKLSGHDGKLFFQWTPEGAKTAGAGNLANCGLDISAGAGKHQFALREPVLLEDQLLVGVDKPAQPLKIILDAAPETKDLVLEIVSAEGLGGATKIDKAQLDASKDYTFVWAGGTPASMPLGVRVETIAAPKGLTVMAAPHLKLEGMSKALRYSKKDFQALKQQVAGELQKGNFMLQIASQTKDRNQKELATSQANQTLEAAQKANVQVEEVTNLLTAAQAGGKIHVRVLFKADELEVVLATTGGVPPAPPGGGGAGKK